MRFIDTRASYKLVPADSSYYHPWCLHRRMWLSPFWKLVTNCPDRNSAEKAAAEDAQKRIDFKKRRTVHLGKFPRRESEDA